MRPRHFIQPCEHCQKPFKPQHLATRFCSKRCSGLAKTQPLRARLFAHISKSTNRHGCWEWTAARQPRGYGLTKIGKRRGVLVHRVIWELTHGPIPQGMCLCHHCDNPPCCNPAHLFLGTKSDNTRDALVKNRLVIRRGEQHGMAKLTEEKVRQIRASHATHRHIAKQYGISRALVSLVKAHAIWRHVF